MSEQEYKDLVLAYYDELVKTSALSSELLSPTPGNIKAKVLKACSDGLDPKDEKTLQSFVGRKADVGEYYKVVDISSADLYKPLVNALKNRSVKTNLRNMDLLAWLIDFHPRPFHPNLTYKPKSVPTGLSPDLTQPFRSSDVTAGVFTHETVSKSSGKIKKRIVLSALLTIIIAAVIYFFMPNIAHRVTGKEGCMIWSDDHYQPVNCTRKSSGTKPIPINHELVDHFKRITKQDTLTFYSVGKVWYAKYNGRVEFYTQAGMHPLDSNRRLLPMSDHILKKYVYHTTN